jgi:hypothetical protein
VVEEASDIPGFCGAYTAGSTNWLPDDADLTTTSDFDIMVVLTDLNQAGKRSKFIYQDILLEVSYVRNDQLESSDLVLSDYHLAPNCRTTNIMLDPSGHLTALLGIVCRGLCQTTLGPSALRQRQEQSPGIPPVDQRGNAPL